MNEIFLSSSFCYLLNALSPLVYSGKHFRALPSMMEMGWHRAVQHILSNLLCFSSFLFCTFSMRGKKKKKEELLAVLCHVFNIDWHTSCIKTFVPYQN